MKAEMRAVILSGAMTFEPAPLDFLEIRVTPIRLIVDRIEPPLDLNVIPFRYRVSPDGEIAPVKHSCRGHQSERRHPGGR
ncbi:MAG TPA: hypothetical protein VJ853_08955 [Thermoanaerobaculia bacterium]|nr:hypothetical protein [Thermoanaerobaculia bacterium]